MLRLIQPNGHPAPLFLRVVNVLLIVLLLSALIAFVIISFAVEKPPYDYWILMEGASGFCFDNADFRWGREQNNYYPAPFYTTFCLPYRYAEFPLRWVWMLTPLFLSLYLARGRAAVLGYAPLGVLLLIGQSSWLIMPLYMMAVWWENQRPAPIRWWYGLIFALAVFKPQVAVVAALWLAWQWRSAPRTLLTGGVAMLLLTLPAFILRPTWIMDWLPNGRGFEPVNLASIAFIPVQLFALPFAAGTAANILVWGFCALVMVGTLWLLWWRRGKLEFYDWALAFFIASPVLNDYDLVVLLPMICRSRQRLLLALTASVLAWVFAMITREAIMARWSMSFMVTLVLLILRLAKPDQVRGIEPAVA
jgi:hypothetical protein